MTVLAIDFGSSTTVAALLVQGQSPRTITFGTSPLLPSAVHLQADGSLVSGAEAVRQARLDPTRFEPTPKRRIDDGEVLLGDRVVPVVELIATVLRTVMVEATRQLAGRAPEEVRLTHPAGWANTRRATLLAAAQAAGLGRNIVLIPEPVAACAWFLRLPGHTLPSGSALAVFDLGGGTTDIAVVARSAESGELHVLAERGLQDLGGLDFDQAVADHVGRSESSRHPGAWQNLLRPTDIATQRAARLLADDVRSAKETLSRYAQTEVVLPDPFTDVLVTRTEFEGLIRPLVVRTVDLLSDTISAAGIGSSQLAGVFLVGGSSRVPLVASLITERAGIVPVTLDQPETTVALGALFAVAGENSRTEVVPSSMLQPPVHQPAPPPQAHYQQPVQQQRPPHQAPNSGVHQQVPPRPAMQTGPIPSVPGRAAEPPPKSRRGLWTAAAGVSAAAVVIIVLFASGVFSGTGNSGATTTSSVSESVPVSSSPSPSASPSSSAPVPSGLDAADAAFLGAGVDAITDCVDTTDQFNKRMAEAQEKAETRENLSGLRVSRCTVQTKALPSDANGKVLLWVVTTEDPLEYLNRLMKSRDAESTKDPVLSNYAAGKRVAVDQVAALSASSNYANDIMAWSRDGHDQVGIIVPSGYLTAEQFINVWIENFQQS